MSVVRYCRVLLITVILVLVGAIRSEAGTNVVPSATGNVMLLPFTTNHPLVGGVDGTLIIQNSTSNFIFQYNLSTNTGGTSPDWDAAMVYWYPWATNASWGYDLSSVTTFVFGVRGTATKLTAEFQSSDGAKSFAYLWLVKTNMQYYSFNKSFITNDITKMRVISFTANYAEVGAVKTGTVEVVVQGLATSIPDDGYPVNPSPTGNVTQLPGAPRVSEVDGTEVTQFSTTNFTINYKLAPTGNPTNGLGWHGAPDWDAAMVYWNNFGPTNLSSITTFVFAVKGTANKVKVEFEATNSVKAIAVLQSVNSTWQYYHIPASIIASNNLKTMKVIAFVAVYDDVGPVKTGTVEVVVRGLTLDSTIINPSPTGNVTQLPGGPRVSEVDGTAVTQLSTSNFVDQL